MAGGIGALRQREEWQFFTVLRRAHAGLAAAWWGLIGLAGLLPAVFSLSTGLLIGSIRHGNVVAALAFAGSVFIVVQVLTPVLGQVGANLGDRLSAWLNLSLLESATSPAGLAHLEAPDLTDDLTLARDYELGLSGPPMSLALSFISGGLIQIVAGLAQSVLLEAYSWWAGLLVAGGWTATHWLLRESTLWDRSTGDVLKAQREADYSYRLAVDPPAAKELRLFGLSPWTVARFTENRRKLVDLRLEATRIGRPSMRWAVLVVTVAYGVFFASLAHSAVTGQVHLTGIVIFSQAAVGASALAFGGLNWALPHAASAVGAVLRLQPQLGSRGRLAAGSGQADGMPATTLSFRDVSFAYAADERPVLAKLNLTIEAGTSLALVGVNGAGKTTLVKLLCRLYDPVSGRIEVDGVDLRELDADSWRSRITAVFQDFARYELPLRRNVAPGGGDDQQIASALTDAGLSGIGLDTVLATGYDNGTDLSGGQWQRVALARALYAVREGAGVIVLDEPTAQLDVRGESEIFGRILEAARGRTTILISHRFSTVRQVDRICVLEDGHIVESGSHSDLMARRGRYHSMYTLQASRFEEELQRGRDPWQQP